MRLLEDLAYEDLCGMLSSRKIIILGAGAVADYFWLTLKEMHLERNVVAVAVAKMNAKADFHGLPIQRIEKVETDRENLVCIAVHDTLYTEILETLQRLSLDVNVVWIKPYIAGMTLRPPIARNKIVPVCKIIKNRIALTNIDYSFAIRWLVIEQYDGKNNIGYDTYIKSFTTFSTKQSAERRLRRYLSLITSWREYGYDDKSIITVDADYTLLDGLHRSTLAVYECQSYVCVDIYPVSPYRKYYIEQFKLTRNKLEERGCSKAELNIIDEARQRMNAQIEFNISGG